VPHKFTFLYFIFGANIIMSQLHCQSVPGNCSLQIGDPGTISYSQWI